MSNQNSTSPAVSSLHDEQAKQRSDDGQLQQGLEDTFPASDPVSHTMTTTATPTITSENTDDIEDTPKVDEALAAVRARSHTPTVSASGRIAGREIRSVRQTIADQVREHPLSALGLAALAGYVWGMTR
ncbi:hypothetical protein [uncultured Agrobacterium sp.]|uniref:hypothetical protein n=1 Tax=uncultured Agrobacterium sp. TaxID=157277 RepID=UPI0025CBAE2D|nr:hypothetical protein [uncultured Agrobacterium sp.]